MAVGALEWLLTQIIIKLLEGFKDTEYSSAEIVVAPGSSSGTKTCFDPERRKHAHHCQTDHTMLYLGT